MSRKKKNLLNENTIRRFMKLAEIDKLSDGFVGGLVNEQEEFEGLPDAADSGPSGLGDVDDLDMGPEEGGDEASELTAAVSNLMGVISDMTGVDIDVDGGDVEDELVDVDLEDEDLMGEQMTGVDPDKGDPEAERAHVGKGTPIASAANPSAIGRKTQSEQTNKAAQYASPDVAVGKAAKAGKAGKAGPAGKGPHAPEAGAGSKGFTPSKAGKAAKAGAQAGVKEALHYRDVLRQEVYRRVNARLQQESRHDAVAEQLSERILQRIKYRR